MPHKNPEVGREYKRRYYLSHREELIAANTERKRIWRPRRSEEVRERERSSRRRRYKTRMGNPVEAEKIRKSLRIYRSSNPEKQRELYRRKYHRNPDLYRSLGRERTNNYNARNRGTVNLRSRNRRKSDPNYRAKARKWAANSAAKNKESTSVKRKALYALSPEKYKKRTQDRRARELCARGHHTIEQWIARIEFYGWQCVYCWQPLTSKTIQKDHRIPLFIGGTEWPSNLVPACKSCNSSKGHKKPSEFYQMRKQDHAWQLQA